jgi:hypothetical protein
MLQEAIFFYSWDGVRLSSLRTSATSGPLVPAPDDDDENWQEKPEVLGENLPQCHHLSYGTILMLVSCTELEAAPWRPITSTLTDRHGSHYQTTLRPVEGSAPGTETVVVPRDGPGTESWTGTARAGCERGGAGCRLGCCRDVTTSSDQEPGLSGLVYRKSANFKNRVSMVN